MIKKLINLVSFSGSRKGSDMALHLKSIFILLLISQLALWTPQYDPPYINTPLPKNVGIYYEYLGSARLKIDKWNILIYVYINEVLSVKFWLDEIREKLLPFCKDTYETNDCIPEKKKCQIRIT